jgi:hypothetical protein
MALTAAQAATERNQRTGQIHPSDRNPSDTTYCKVYRSLSSLSCGCGQWYATERGSDLSQSVARDRVACVSRRDANASAHA